MRYFYVVLAAAGILLLLALLLALSFGLRRRYARKKVCSLCPVEKRRRLNAALEPFGFCYEEKDDSISSRMYPWQRQMGYCRAYDEAAAAMNMVIDCRPVYFNYAGRRYLIELWKGQYGCATGAEIGVYVNASGDFERPPEELFYECAGDEECLPMQFVLFKDGKAILQRKCVHWWLTGFRVGMFSQPEELKLEAGISFPGADMCRAFCRGLLDAGYEEREIRVERNAVFFSFGEPCVVAQSGPQAAKGYDAGRNAKGCDIGRTAKGCSAGKTAGGRDTGRNARGCDTGRTAEGCNADRAARGRDAGRSAKGYNDGRNMKGCDANKAAKGCSADRNTKGCSAGRNARGCSAGRNARGCSAGRNNIGRSAGDTGRYQGWRRRRAMHRNRRSCQLYCRLTNGFCSALDRISFLGFCFPLLYRMLIRIGMKCSPRKYRRYRRRHYRGRSCRPQSMC